MLRIHSSCITPASTRSYSSSLERQGRVASENQAVNRLSKTAHPSIDRRQHNHGVECSQQKPQLRNPHARLHSVQAAAVKTSKGARRWERFSGSIAEPAGICGPNQQKRRRLSAIRHVRLITHTSPSRRSRGRHQDLFCFLLPSVSCRHTLVMQSLGWAPLDSGQCGRPDTAADLRDLYADGQPPDVQRCGGGTRHGARDCEDLPARQRTSLD